MPQIPSGEPADGEPAMAIAWEEPRKAWNMPELILRDWRGRPERLAEEGRRCSRLPGVVGVAVIGTVPRGTVWPLSDTGRRAQGG